MGIRKIAEKTYGPNENGEVYTYFIGFCDSSDDKPVTLVADGSNVIETDTGAWYFFNEKSKKWNVKMTVKRS